MRYQLGGLMALPGSINFAQEILLDGLREKETRLVQCRNQVGIRNWQGVDMKVLQSNPIPLEPANLIADFLANGASPTIRADGASVIETFQAGELFALESVTITERDRYRAPNNLTDIIKEYALKRCDYLWWFAIVNTNAITEGSFRGLPQIVPATQTVDNGGIAPDIDKIDEAQMLLTTSSGKNGFWMVNRRGYRAFKKALRSVPAGMVKMMTVSVPDAKGNPVLKDVLSYDGFPILVNDFIPITDDTPGPENMTDFWLIDPTAVYGFSPDNGPVVKVREETVITGGSEIFVSANWTVGLAVQQTCGVARLSNVLV